MQPIATTHKRTNERTHHPPAPIALLPAGAPFGPPLASVPSVPHPDVLVALNTLLRYNHVYPRWNETDLPLISLNPYFCCCFLLSLPHGYPLLSLLFSTPLPSFLLPFFLYLIPISSPPLPVSLYQSLFLSFPPLFLLVAVADKTQSLVASLLSN